LYCLLLTSLLAACRPDETTLRQPTFIAGHWRSTGTTCSFYTDGVLTDREATDQPTRETYHFASDGTFVLRQGDHSFSIQGRWHYAAARRQLTLHTTGGETLYWTVTDATADRLILSQVQQVPFHGHTQRLEATMELALE
jgi:outer membrane biogenesis lipoprotein LolB